MQNTKKDIWLDCDPGHDDMLAIILAGLHEEINLLGISTSAGNSTIQNTTQNTLNILLQIDREDIEVYQGSPNPLCRQLNTAPDIHGASGLEGAQLKVSKRKAKQENVFLQIYNKITRNQNKVHFVVTGAMTNLAILLKAFPDIKTKLQSITIMGGAIGRGNWSPAAQFNILVDPQAAQIVFNCGMKITMVPLQVTHTVEVSQKIFTQIKQLKSSFGQKLFDLMKYFQKQYKYHQDFQYPVAHDPCTIYYLLHPDKFQGRDCHVEIDLHGNSRGRTNCSFMHIKYANCFVCQKVNVQHFWEVMMKEIQKIK